ncbi:MAG: SDR family oxidoreductase [Saprospiraceae bacterium]|nr:SDR family oxidoreductase [Saprospiraceae bacterium]
MKKTAIVTGGVKGIGWAACQALHRDNFNVVILDWDDRGSDQVMHLGEDSLFIKCDVSQEQAVADAMQKVIDHFGAIDVLVNNAGIQRYSTVTETTVEEWDLVMNINLKSAFLCAKHAIPHMQKVGEGVVINVSSVQAFLSQQNVAPYTTAKTAMLGLTRSIAVDYAPEVRCIAVCPGTIDTPMLRDSLALSPDPEAVYEECVDMHLLKRIGSPSEVGELIAYLASEKSRFFTGQAIRIDGGLGIMVAGSKRN